MLSAQALLNDVRGTIVTEPMRPLRRRMRQVPRLRFLILALIALTASASGVAGAHEATTLAHEGTGLEKLTTEQFGQLSAAETKMILAAPTGEIAWCGPGSDEDVPDYDPARAASWGSERAIRASLIDWLSSDAKAAPFIHPGGLSVAGARVVGRLSLYDHRLRFPLALIRCAIPEGIDLYHAQAPSLNFRGSSTSMFDARGIVVQSDVRLRNGFRTAAASDFTRAEIGGDLLCGGHFAKGLSALQATVKGSVVFEEDFVTDGMIDLTSARIGNNLGFYKATFTGMQANGLEAWRAVIDGAFYWIGVTMTPTTQIDLRDARAALLQDEAMSWPARGQLTLDGFMYDGIEGPRDVKNRLDWLSHQGSGYFPQPYRQLAKVLRDGGDQSAATEILIAQEEAQRKSGGLSRVQRAWKYVLKITIGYGYQPLQALWWIIPFVLLGTLLFGWGYRAGVVTPSEGAAHDVFIREGKLTPGYQPFHSFVYSLDTFLPLVQLHQEEYWLPNPETAPPLRIPVLGWKFNLGGFLRFYLWVQILAGWIIGTLLAAGLAGLVHTE